MLLILKRFAVLGVLSVCCISTLSAQRSSAAKGINTLAAPVPTPLLNGKRAFISYELGDVAAFPSGYSGGPERAYNEFFAGMQNWGRFQLVMDPKDADVVFAVRFVESPGLSLPQIRVGISDAKTHVALWGFVEQINPHFFKKNRDATFSAAVQLLVSDVEALITPGVAKPASTTGAGETGPSDQVQ
jgi:hypothetical protein